MAGETTPPSPVRVAMTPGSPPMISLEARNAPLGQVLDELAVRADAVIHRADLPAQPVTATCAGATLKTVLRCLLGAKTDLVVRKGADEPGKSRPATEVWILGSSLATQQPSAGGTGSCMASAGAAKPAGKSPDELAREQRERMDKLLAMADDPNPGQRAAAIDRLTSEKGIDDATAQRVLDKATADPDVNVRSKAIWALYRRGGAAASAVLQAAFRDDDQTIRLTAIDAARNDAEGLALLETASGDADEVIRLVAEDKLQTFKHNGAP